MDQDVGPSFHFVVVSCQILKPVILRTRAPARDLAPIGHRAELEWDATAAIEHVVDHRDILTFGDSEIHLVMIECIALNQSWAVTDLVEKPDTCVVVEI